MSSKKVFSASDAAPVVLYAHKENSQIAYPVRMDGATYTLQTIEYEHHEIHAGSHFFVVGHQTLSINNVLDLTFKTPNTTSWIHWIWKIDTGGETNWLVYENAVATNALTTSVTVFNNDRNSAKTSGTTLLYELQSNLAAANTDTDVTTATLLESGISGGGRTAGSDRRDSEIILKQNTLYCLRAIATAAGYIDFSMQWYEHTNK